MIHFNLYQIVGNIVVWGLIAPTLDVLIYSEPAIKVYTQGVIAVILNIISVGVIGTLLMAAYAATRTKKGVSLRIKSENEREDGSKSAT